MTEKIPLTQFESYREVLRDQASCALLGLSIDIINDYILHDDAFPKFKERLETLSADMEELKTDIIKDFAEQYITVKS